MLRYFDSAETFWNTEMPRLGGKKARSLMEHSGAPDYSFDEYVRGEYGERVAEYFETQAMFMDADDDPELLEYWRSYGKGLEKRVFWDESDRDKSFFDFAAEFHSWCAYVPCAAFKPEGRGRKFPMIVIGQRTDRMMNYEASGFIHFAAENEIIILTGCDVNNDRNFEHMLEEAIRLYPVDESRIYLHGHSFGAVLSGRHAIKYCRRIAGVCTSGSQYFGVDNTKDEIDLAQQLRMPIIAIHCTKQSRNLLPYNVTPRFRMSPKNQMNVTTSDFCLLSGYEELKFWRMINHCAPIRMENMRNIQQTSQDRCEQVLGIEVDASRILVLADTNHYVGDIYDDNGTVMLRYIGVEGGPHAVPPFAAQLAWEFLSDFSRDIETGALLRHGKAVGEADPFWTTAYPAIGMRTPREYIGSKGSPRFDFTAYVAGAMDALQQDRLYTRMHFAGDEPALKAWWEQRGMIRSEDADAIAYLPKGVKQPVPLVLYCGNTDDPMDAEADGFAHAAAENGVAVMILRNVNDDALAERVLAKALAMPEIDSKRISMAGFGFGAACAGRHAVRMVDHVAALCLMGTQYYGYDSYHAQVAHANQVGLPMIAIHGTEESRGILPYNCDPELPLPPKRADNVTMSSLSLITGYAEVMFWRQMNGCAPIELSQMSNTEALANDPTEAVIGMPFDETEIREVAGKTYYIGSILDGEKKPVIRYAAMLGAPHFCAATNASLALEFFSKFSR